MEQLRTVHYEIQLQKSDGKWAELLHGRPETEEEISELVDRASTANPGKKIRAVKVTTTVTLEDLSKEPRPPIPACELESPELHHEDPVNELLQDCD